MIDDQIHYPPKSGRHTMYCMFAYFSKAVTAGYLPNAKIVYMANKHEQCCHDNSRELPTRVCVDTHQVKLLTP